MSHFSVLVVTDTPEQVEETLQPFHEYECTGVKDQYVVEVDKTPEVEKDLARVLFVGTNKETGDQDYEFHLERAEKSLDNFVNMTQREFILLKGESIDNYIREDYGYEMKDGKWITETNPNAKWDWYQVGGRWSGLLKPKNPEIGEKGKPGLMGSEYDAEGIDQCIKSNVDFEGRMKEAAESAAEEYDATHLIINSRDYKSWGECREEFKVIDDAREYYNNQGVIIDLKKKYDHPFADLDKYKTDRESFIKTASNSVIATFAVIKDGKWYERGDMGWFGCVSDEKDTDAWNGEFKDLLDTISDDKCLTVVDCHI